MNWKNWPYWVKGTAVAFGIFVVLWVATILWHDYYILFEYIVPVLFYVPEKIATFLTPLFCTPAPEPFLECLETSLMLTGLTSIAEIFIVGSLGGYLYEKFKNRNKALVNRNVS